LSWRSSGDRGLGDHEEDDARLRDARRGPQCRSRALCRHSGQPGDVKTALLSGGLAALAGFSEVAGLKGNLTLDLSPGYGYTGIVVAMLAMLNPLGVIAAAIFVAGIFVGADAMSRSANVPSYIAEVMVATALLTMVTAIMLMRYRVRWR
jgi:ABC-type uncharacterized transport system permease subunit